MGTGWCTSGWVDAQLKGCAISSCCVVHMRSHLVRIHAWRRSHRCMHAMFKGNSRSACTATVLARRLPWGAARAACLHGALLLCLHAAEDPWLARAKRDAPHAAHCCRL